MGKRCLQECSCAPHTVSSREARIRVIGNRRTRFLSNRECIAKLGQGLSHAKLAKLVAIRAAQNVPAGAGWSCGDMCTQTRPRRLGAFSSEKSLSAIPESAKGKRAGFGPAHEGSIPSSGSMDKETKESVCILCGTSWVPYLNVCVNPECGGFCTWGSAKDADPDSWIVTNEGWIPRPP